MRATAGPETTPRIIPRRSPLAAFREEIARNYRDPARAKAGASLSNLQQHFYQALSPEIAAQILLIIQHRTHQWVTEGKVVATWAHPARNKLLPLARPQLLMLETEHKKDRYASRT